MSDLATLLNTAVAILAAVVMIVPFKFNPVVSLVIGSVYLGLAAGLGVEKTIETITSGFGDIMAEVGLADRLRRADGRDPAARPARSNAWSSTCCRCSAPNGCRMRCR